MDYSSLDSSIHGISQARILEWGAIFSSRWSAQPKEGLNSHLLSLLHWQADSLTLNHLGSPISIIHMCKHTKLIHSFTSYSTCRPNPPKTKAPGKVKVCGREQGGGGVGGCGVHLSPRIHQEYTFRHRSACTPPAESTQQHLTGGKGYISSVQFSRSVMSDSI